ncbi:hypothetical protein [Phaeobacter sp. JH20_12]|uniref:hypothetical protein n=2 Tax=Phaeobacter TaxID=302485 RepID=UPI003A8AC578
MRYDMIGVVLWTDYDLRQAVIWSEDHGDLVYYRWTSLDEPIELRKGDCVAFRVETKGALRFASDLDVIEESQSPELAAKLGDAEHEASQSLPNSRSEATVMTWEDARHDPLFVDPSVYPEHNAHEVKAPVRGAGDSQPSSATILSFPDKQARDARAQAKRRSADRKLIRS